MGTTRKDGRSTRAIGARFVGVAAAALISAALAGPAGAVDFDPPVKRQQVAGKDGAEVVCTTFSDVTLIERLDGPTALAPVLVADPKARCGAPGPGRGVELELTDMSFVGRVGPMMIFSQMDPHGAVEIAVAEVILDKKVVFRDAADGDPLIRKAAIGRSAFHLGYVRGINASCSLRQDARACWAQLVGEGKIPKEMAGLAPDGSICAKSYAETGAPPDAPSIVTWTNEVEIFPDGHYVRTSQQDFGCLAQP
ncbi:hypothetical protein [Pinisolibacter aquiterrae]|uniref:hypothetical protein n=1 Tax=Pinisolibacter aquiterrae TaxID=2815579 RepID=UPI001C3D3AE0|nr:hypothetical protein [Pinisolibacter aquiterrae]MBV5265271.1 hypothetical protein [Pinisolibacter aquiterrae]MCC8235400.1 hypothetical protein [Pinisolibacter aquiterrae]